MTMVNLDWQRMRKTQAELNDRLMTFVDKTYGAPMMAAAWEEFALGRDDEYIEPEIEMEPLFLPWFLFNWVANPYDPDSRVYPELTIAEQYMQKHGSRLSQYERQYIEEVMAQPFSFFIVKDVQAGQWIMLHDLLLGREVKVMEREASKELEDGAIMYARVLTMNETSVMLGCSPFVIPPQFSHKILDFRDTLMAMPMEPEPIDIETLFECDIEIRDLYFDLKEAMFTQPMPELHNTDGEMVQLTTLHYQLDCPIAEAVEALASLAIMEVDELIEDAVLDSDGELESVEFPWLQKGNAQHRSWDNTVLGHIVLEKGRLEIEVNSQERAEAIKRKITRRLGKRARFLRAVIQSQEKLLERAGEADSNGQAEQEALMNLPEVQEAIRQMAEQHWQDWLDTPLPALRGQTPRQAAKASQGRERLEALLLEFEYNSHPDPVFAPDVAALRLKLGL